MLDPTESTEMLDDGNTELIEVNDGASVVLVSRKELQEFGYSENETHIPKQTLLPSVNPLSLKQRLSQRLDKSHPAVVTIYTIVTAFSAYFSIYGISASLFAATFDGAKLGSLELKVAFSMAQLIGYAISKVVGALAIPTIKRNRRLPILILLAVLGETPLVLFGLLPPAGQVVMVFLSALPMAWMWGIMVMYLEGRKTSEFLLMGLYLSVMVASGTAKSIATAVLHAGVPESWMPSLCGAGAAVIFISFITLLDAIPDPSADDKRLRSERRTLSPSEARAFLRRWAPGLAVITLVYAALTSFRNFRDYFAPELWRDLEGAGFNPTMFTQSELPVGICTAVAYSMLYWVQDNKKAFFAILGVMFLGGGVILFATVIQVAGLIDPLPWMIMVGVGLFMAYIPPGAMLYDRFNGATGVPYTSVFMIYLSDVCGYSITLTVLFYRNFGDANIPYVEFFHSLSYIVSVVCMGGMVVAACYFAVAMRNLRKPTTDASAHEEGVALTEVRTRADSDPEVDAHADSHTYTHAESSVGVHVDAQESTNADAQASTHADANANTYADASAPKFLVEMRELPPLPASP